MACLTYYTVDAILSHRPFRNNHKVGLDASLSQIVTSVTSIPWLHIELTMKTLHGALWDVDTTSPHTKVRQVIDLAITSVDAMKQ